MNYFDKVLSIRILSIFMLLCSNLFAQMEVEPNVPEKEGKILTAYKINPHPPKIDGDLNDIIWHKAKIISDFTQEDPEIGVQPTEKTEVQVAYDDEAIYIAVRAYDSEPNKITSRLTRRDDLSESDLIYIAFDSRHDHQTAYAFATNPAGVQKDQFHYNDTWTDDSWNAVWEVNTRIDAQGWVAEFKIPFSMLRFSQEEEHIWGFNVMRTINRKKETIKWVYRPRESSGEVSRFGHLAGIKGVKSPRQLEILPYFVPRQTFDNGSKDFHGGIGSDFKYGLSSGFTLDGTINPDFGQVEADPSVLNLSAFETFFPEKRSFFIEGSKMFNTPFRLFHSRRIGKNPGRFGVEDGDEILERPDNTTILSAAKLTGKTSSGTSVGILEAVTADEHAAVIDSNGNRHNRLIEPLTNYFVGRVKKDIFAGNSTIGAIATAVNRESSESAYTGGIDWDLKFMNNTYNTRGQIATSYVNKESGYGVNMSFNKSGGKWLRGNVYFEAESPGFNINDIGFLRRNDWIGTSNWFQIRTQDPIGFIRRSYNNFNGWLGWNYDGNNLSKGMNFNNSIQLMNYWWFGGGFNHNFRRVSDSDTFRGGTLILRPANNNWWLWIDSDSRKPIAIGPFMSRGWDENGSEWSSYHFSTNIKPSTKIQFRISGGYNLETQVAQWVDNVDKDNDEEIDHYVYGELNTKVLNATLEGTVTFSRDLTLQVYMQPFIAVGKYGNFKELIRPESFDFKSYPYDDDNPDFNSKSFNSNIILRWEYRPGSRVYFVWSQSRSNGDNPGQFRFGRDVRNLFGKDIRSFFSNGTNILLVKLDYWLNI